MNGCAHSSRIGHFDVSTSSLIWRQLTYSDYGDWNVCLKNARLSSITKFSNSNHNKCNDLCEYEIWGKKWRQISFVFKRENILLFRDNLPKMLSSTEIYLLGMHAQNNYVWCHFPLLLFSNPSFYDLANLWTFQENCFENHRNFFSTPVATTNIIK